MQMRIQIDVRDPRKAEAVAQALAADSRPRRGQTSFSRKGSKLVIGISCEDSAAMRAALNSSLRVAEACLSVIG